MLLALGWKLCVESKIVKYGLQFNKLHTSKCIHMGKTENWNYMSLSQKFYDEIILNTWAFKHQQNQSFEPCKWLT